MERVSGLVSETKPLEAGHPGGVEVISYSPGDIVRCNGFYAVIIDLFTNHAGNKCLRLGAPMNGKTAMELQRWGRANPHWVKVLESCHVLK